MEDDLADGDMHSAPFRRPAAGWTPQEDELLKTGVRVMGPRNWKAIAQEYLAGRRTDVQCLHRWQKVLRPGLVKGPWTEEEDRIIVECMTQGIHKWSEIAARIPGRLGKQCRERWVNHLDPSISKSSWDPEEDAKLVALYTQFGTRWKVISEHMPGRSENAVKNRWNSMRRKRTRLGSGGAAADGGADSGDVDSVDGAHEGEVTERKSSRSMLSSAATGALSGPPGASLASAYALFGSLPASARPMAHLPSGGPTGGAAPFAMSLAQPGAPDGLRPPYRISVPPVVPLWPAAATATASGAAPRRRTSVRSGLENAVGLGPAPPSDFSDPEARKRRRALIVSTLELLTSMDWGELRPLLFPRTEEAHPDRPGGDGARRSDEDGSDLAAPQAGARRSVEDDLDAGPDAQTSFEHLVKSVLRVPAPESLPSIDALCQQAQGV